MAIDLKIVTSRLLCLLALVNIFILAPWELAFQNSMSQGSILLDFLSFIAVVIAVKLDPRDIKSSKDWIRILIYAAPYVGVAGIFGFNKPLLHAISLLRAYVCISNVSHTGFLSIHTKLKRNYELCLTLLLISGIIHSLACMWIGINGREGDLVTVYNKAIYWTVTTVATVGYGDITPSTNLGRTFAIIVMLVGVGFYGFVVSKISTFLFQKDRRSEIRDSKMSNLGAFLDHYKIPAKLRNEVYGFYDHRLQEQTNDEEVRILSELPEQLRLELQIYLNIAPLAKTHLFKNCTEECLREASILLERRVFGPAAAIIKKGEIGHEMYVIAHGQVRVSVSHEVLAILQKGQYFGESALISSSPRSADVTAESYCDLYVLTKDRFDFLMTKYPELRENVRNSYNRK